MSSREHSVAPSKVNLKKISMKDECLADGPARKPHRPEDMNKAEKKEPLCETSERCRPILSEDELELIRTAVGRRLAEAFDFRSDREIACLLKTSCKTINSVINGKEFPPTEMLLLINCLTGVSIHWLLTGDGMKSHIPSTMVLVPDELVALGLA